MDERLDEVTTSPPRGSRAAGVGRPPRPQRVEQRKLSSRNFYANERKKCKSGPLSLSVLVAGAGKEDGGPKNLNASSFRELSMSAGLYVTLARQVSRLPRHKFSKAPSG